LRYWQIKISDQEAWNFGAMGLLVLLIVAASLYVTSWVTHTDEIAASNLVGIFMYVKDMVMDLILFPTLFNALVT